MDTYKVIVVGAGPAGMMAAIRAAQKTSGVLLIEKNASLGRKLGLTGKGRCNLTNACPLDEFMANFGKNGLFLRDAFKRFFVRELIYFFEKNGLKLKTERQERVFPQTDSSKSVVDVFKKVLHEERVEVVLSAAVKSVLTEGGRVQGVCLDSGEKIFADSVVLATGGLSYPQTGSTGDGFKMAERMGHRIESFSPGLVPLETREDFVPQLQGLTLKNISISFLCGKKTVRSSVGELLFTHFGISGPLVLDASAFIAGQLNRQEAVKISIDLKPGMTPDEIDAKLRRDLQQSGSAMIKNYLEDMLPKRLVPFFLVLASVDGPKKCHQIAALERRRIAETFKNFSLTVVRTRPLTEAMVTHGGVSLQEVNPKTMGSKIISGLYFCGEVLDLAASTGGFNLQAAFSTGYIAGESAAQP